jgi:hypothetical protein
VVASLELIWALAGFIAEPSFDFGDDAVTERVLWGDAAAALIVGGTASLS